MMTLSIRVTESAWCFDLCSVSFMLNGHFYLLCWVSLGCVLFAGSHSALSAIILNDYMLDDIVLSIVLLNVIILNVQMLSVVLLNAIMLDVIILSVKMLSVVLLNSIMLSVVAPNSTKLPQINGRTPWWFTQTMKSGRKKVFFICIHEFSKKKNPPAIIQISQVINKPLI